MRRQAFVWTLGILLVFALPATQPVHAGSATTYTVTDLGSFGGLVPTITGINASGQISGYTTDAKNIDHAVWYDPAAGWSAVPGATAPSRATGINAHGDLSGYETTSAGVRGFRYMAGAAAPVALSGVLPNGTFTRGMAINDNDDVVGLGNSSSGTRGWIAVGTSTTISVLSTLPGGSMANACGINNSGVIAGTSATSAGVLHGYRINTDGSITDIGSLDGSQGSSSACAIDDDGRVEGNSSIAGSTHAVRFDAAGLADIDSFDSPFSSVNAVAAGVGVGFYFTADFDQRAFVQEGTDAAADLNDRLSAANGWILTNALAVNTNGAIAGSGLLNGNSADFLLTPQTGDTTPPTITTISASPSTITPANNAAVPVTISVTATDNIDASPACSLDSITTAGPASAAASVTGTLAGTVTAAGGSTYTFDVTCADASGNKTQGSVNVVVPPDTVPPVITSLSATPSTIVPPAGQMVPVTISVSATDDSGLTPACDLAGISGPGTQGVDYGVTGQFTGTVKAVGGRTYTFTARCIDGAGNATSGSVDVVVPPDRTPPVIASVSATPGFIWPPDNKMTSVALSVSVSDDVDPAPACALTAISGSPADTAITGALSASVRASNGNLYTLTVTCRDFSGNTSTASTMVSITKAPTYTLKVNGKAR